MNISIQQFKSISSVDEFSLDGLTLLAGAISSGKSSIIQALLLLKQTLEGSSDDIITLQGDYVNAREFSELIHNKSQRGATISLKWRKEDIVDVYDMSVLMKYSSLQQIDDVFMSITLKSIDSAITVTDFILAFESQGKCDRLLLHYNSMSRLYELTSNLINVNKWIRSNSDNNNRILIKGCKVDFLNFFPIFISCEDEGLNEKEFTLLVMKDMRSFLSSFLRNIYYIGPNRVSPALDRFYSSDTISDRVDSTGYNTRYILAEQKNKIVGDRTLAEEVNFWVKQLGLANEISANKDNETKLYKTSVSVSGKLKVDLCNTGFGNSQILPIIVQGLLAPKGSLLIIEDPEVHMHPAVQSAMTDFFIAMANLGKNIMLETHSDHIVTRIRRRVIEKPKIRKMIHICYVENIEGDSEYITLEMDDRAMFKRYPELPKGFMDAQDEDFREIIRLKME